MQRPFGTDDLLFVGISKTRRQRCQDYNIKCERVAGRPTPLIVEALAAFGVKYTLQRDANEPGSGG